jgi:hypothetical protein
VPQSSYLAFKLQGVIDSLGSVDDVTAQTGLQMLEPYVYAIEAQVGMLARAATPISTPSPTPVPDPTPPPTPTPAPTPASTSARSLTVTSPVQTGVATTDMQGCVAYPDAITPAGKITFAGTYTGTFKNLMMIVPGIAAWQAGVLDSNGGWTCSVDLSGTRTGPMNVRVIAWYDDPTEKQLVLDFALLVDNPAVVRAALSVPAPAAGMKPLLVDDFDVLPDDSRWGFGVRPDGSQWGSDAHFTTKDGDLAEVFQLPMPSCLRIRAVHDDAFVDPQGWNRKWRSGLLCTAYSDGRPPVAAFRKGYVEMRAILPIGVGMWPSMWGQALGDTPNSMRSGPPANELDALEAYCQTADPGKYALSRGVIGWGVPAGGYTPNGPRFIDPFDATSDFHTYGALIDDSSMTVFVDGTLIEKIEFPAQGTTDKYFWMFDLALGAGWPIITPPAKCLDMWIDYIRIYSAD